MELTQLGCCAFNEILDLGEHSTPEEAMSQFVSDVETDECTETYGEYVTKLDPGAFYLFTAVVKEDGVVSSHRYGHAFAAYIRTNKLGVVKETQTRYNRKNEPTHLIHGWIWAPSKRNLTKWWKARKGGD